MKCLQGLALVDNISAEVVLTSLEVVQLFGFTCIIYNNFIFLIVLIWTILLKSLLNLLQYCFYFGFLSTRHVGS